MQNHYEINVAFEGKHLFATHERSAVGEGEALALALYATLKGKFQKRHGYEVSIVFYEACGQSVTEKFDKRLRTVGSEAVR